MFMRVKHGSLFWNRSEFRCEFCPRPDVDRAGADAAVDHCLALGLGQSELGLVVQHLDLDGRVGPIAVDHGHDV